MIKSSDVEKAVLGAASEPEKDIIRRIVVAGQTILFDEKAHRPMFQELLGGEGDVSEKLGNGVAHVLLMLYDKSRPGQAQPQPAAPVQPAPAQPTGLINAQASAQPAQPATQPEQPKAPATMPKGGLTPAGTILLTGVADFAVKAGIAQIDDATISNALQAMFVKIYDRWDSTFRDRVASKRGAQPAQLATQPTGGIINGAGA